MKLRKYLKEKKYFVHLLATIACLICIPLIVAQLLMMEVSTQGYFRMNEENVLEKMQERTTAIMQKIEDMSITAIRVGQDAVIRKASRATSSDYAVWEATQKLKEYSSDDWSVGVWFYDSGKVLIDEVRIRPELLYQILGGGEDAVRWAVKDFFEQEGNIRVMSTSEYTAGNGGTVLVAMPVSFRFSPVEKDALVFFVMEQGTIIDEFLDKFYDCSGIAVVDPDGKFLIRSADFSRDLLKDEDFRFFAENERENSYSFTYEDERFCVYKQKTADGYTCFVSMNEKNQELHLREYVNNIRIIMITSVVLMLILMTITVSITYRPVRLLTKKHGSRTTETGLSEFELLDSAFFMVDQKVLSMNQLLKDSIVADLLSGRPVDARRLEENRMDQQTHGCVVVALNGPAITSAQSAEIIAAIKSRCACDIYITGITYRPQILMVFALHQEISTELLAMIINSKLKAIVGHEYDISMGKTVKRIKDIRASYLSILTAARNHDSSELGISDHMADLIKRFGESIHSADPLKIQKCLDVIESSLEDTNEQEAFKKYYCYKLLMVYFANAGDAYCSKEEMNRLLNFTNTRQLFVMMKQSVRTVCALMKESESTTANKLGKKLLDYVDANYTKPELCLTSAADYMGTSIYVVSRLFKDVTGKGFKEFVTDKRLEYARALLEDINENVSAVSVLSGFENPVYFSNLFKAKYGLAPTQYRKMRKTE